MTVCTVTGTLRNAQGNALVSTKVIFERSSVLGQSGAVVMPTRVEATSDEQGEIEVTLYPGTYSAQVAGLSGPAKFAVGVPDAETADLADIIDQFPAITPSLLTQAVAARDAAEASASRVDLGALDAAVDATAADAQATAADRVATGLDAAAANTARLSAETADASAKIARDAAFVNADVYADTASGLAATTVGDQFQVVAGEEIIRYRHEAGPAAIEVARYSSAILVRDHERLLTGVIEATANLLNKDDPEVADNFFVNSTTGALQANNDYWASGFIPVAAGQTYYIAPKNYIAWYDASRVFISGSPNTDTNPVQVAPAGAAFLRISLYILIGANPETAYVALGSTALAAYVPYGGSLALDPRRVPDGIFTPTKTSFLAPGKNLFNKATRTLDAIQSTSGVTVNASYDLSDFIPVEEGKTYQYRSAAGGARFRACFNATGANVTAQAATAETNSYTVPLGSGVVSMRLSIAKARVDDFMVEEAAAPTAFEPFGFKFTDEILEQGIPGLVSSWSGKKCSSYGDSITAQLQWQPKIAAELGLVHTAFGVGGRQISGTVGMCQDAAVNAIPTDTELLLVLGGTNDWAQSRSLGSVDSTNTEEFYGALNQMAEKLTTRLPTCRIAWLTTPYGELPGRLTDGSNWPSPAVNNVGLTTRAYADAVRVAARRWGFPVIDLDQCGWNEINLTTYMQDDGGSVHPNTLGGARIAEIAIGRLKSLEPYA